jgi:hypothetical protein
MMFYLQGFLFYHVSNVWIYFRHKPAFMLKKLVANQFHYSHYT